MENNTLYAIAALLLKHFICDFPLQRPFHYLNKGKYGHLGGIAHAAIHAAGTLLVCIAFDFPLWAAALDGALHYHIDWAKVRINNHYKLKPDNSEYYWWLLGLDQLLHGLTYVLICAL